VQGRRFNGGRIEGVVSLLHVPQMKYMSREIYKVVRWGAVAG